MPEIIKNYAQVPFSSSRLLLFDKWRQGDAQGKMLLQEVVPVSIPVPIPEIIEKSSIEVLL